MSKFSVVLALTVILLSTMTPSTLAIPLIGEIRRNWGCATCVSRPVSCTVFGSCGASSLYGPPGAVFSRPGIISGAVVPVAGAPVLGHSIALEAPQSHCLLGRYACFGRIIRPFYPVHRVSTYVPVAVHRPENIVVNNNNQVDIVAPPQPVEQETVSMTYTEIAPVTVVEGVTESYTATETLPAETVTANNYITFTQQESFTESYTATETLPAETVTMNNFVTFVQQETVPIIVTAAPSPLPYAVQIVAHAPVAAPCQEACVEAPECTSEGAVCA